MIPRYSRPQMTRIWEAENRFRIWFAIESHVCDALARFGVIPAEAARNIRENGKWDSARIDEIEQETRHDVLAFLTNLGESIGDDARYLHQGMTSSDVLDTALAVQLTQASDLLLADLDEVLAALKVRVEMHLDTVCIGRSHGIHAEPTSFGLKLATHYAAFKRARARLQQARAEIATCAVSGPVGTFATVAPRIEAYVAEQLGLTIEPISTQIIPRDRHAMFFATLGVIASSIENLVTEIRHLQRSEVREVEEAFAKGQKGSSAMPHKRNPVLSENLTGIARIVRAAVVPAMENVTLWHERDISHSAVERVFAPDATIALDFGLIRLAGLIKGMVIYPERIQENMNALGGLYASQRVMLALIDAGMSREEAYAKTQTHAMNVWQQLQAGEKRSFQSELASDGAVTGRLPPEKLVECFDTSFYIRHARAIWARVV